MIVRQLSDSAAVKNIVSVEGELTLRSVTEAAEKLYCYLNTHKELVLDMSNVSELDSAGAQLILLLHKKYQNLYVSRCNELVMEVIQKLNICYLLDSDRELAHDR